MGRNRMDLTGFDADKFWTRVDRSDEASCWNSKRAKTAFGYGHLKFNRTYLDCHRIAYALTYGNITSSQWVLHTCDNPPCCNPLHLRLGDAKSNSADCVSKNRQAAGESHGRHRLKWLDVCAMRELHELGWGAPDIGRAFGISNSHAWSCVTRNKWRTG